MTSSKTTFTGDSLLKRILLTLGFILVLSFTSLFVFGQSSGPDYPTADLSEEGVIILPVGEPIESKYMIDLSGLEFNSDQEMIQFISEKAGEGYFLRAIPHMNKAVLVLKSGEQRSGWTCSEWNAHFSHECASKPITQ